MKLNEIHESNRINQSRSNKRNSKTNILMNIDEPIVDT